MRDVWVYAVPGERYALVRGRVGKWFAGNRIPALRSPRQAGYRIRHERVADVVAQLEVSGYRVAVRHHMAPPHTPSDDYDGEVAA
jgi:hypothetical protein